MRNRDDYNDVRGRRFRDERYGGRRTGYANSDPDFANPWTATPDDWQSRSWSDDLDERLGWEGDSTHRRFQGRSGRDYESLGRTGRMDLPHGEEGGYMNRGPRSSGDRGHFSSGYGGNWSDDREERIGGFYGARGDNTRDVDDYGRRRGSSERRDEWRGRGRGRMELDQPRSRDWRGGSGGYGNRMWDEDDRDLDGFRGNERGRSFGGAGGGRDFGSDWEDERRMRGGSGYGSFAGVGRGEYRQSNDSFGTGGRNFCGVGPRGYSRSRDRVREDICELLTDAPHIDASDLDIEVDAQGIVTLRGEVESRREKRMIEDCIDRVRGVRDVRNEIVVRGRMQSPSMRSRSSSVEAASGQKTANGNGSGNVQNKTSGVSSSATTRNIAGKKKNAADKPS